LVRRRYWGVILRFLGLLRDLEHKSQNLRALSNCFSAPRGSKIRPKPAPEYFLIMYSNHLEKINKYLAPGRKKLCLAYEAADMAAAHADQWPV
jgi:hypothetical protein